MGDLLMGVVRFDFELFALKLALGRLSATVKRDPAARVSAARELRQIFVECAALPLAQRDLAKLVK